MIIEARNYSPKIDIWSVGCICAELFLGLPIFPGNDSYDQLYKIVKFWGKYPDDKDILKGGNSQKYFYSVEGKYVFKNSE